MKPAGDMLADSAMVGTSRRVLSRLPGGPCPRGHNYRRQRGSSEAAPSLSSTSRRGSSCGVCSRELAGTAVRGHALHHHSRLYSVPSTWSCWVYQSGGAEFPGVHRKLCACGSGCMRSQRVKGTSLKRIKLILKGGGKRTHPVQDCTLPLF